jgi:hypothetical protein
VYARVAKHVRAPGGDIVTIAYWIDGQAEQIVDAFQLAEDCYQSWRDFLLANGIPPP